MEKYLKIVKPNNAVSEEDISLIENKLGIRFPSEYKRFLSNYNGGSLYYNSFERNIDENQTQEQCIDYFESLESIVGAWENLKVYDFFMEANIIPIAQSLGNTLIGVGYKKDNYGKIFVFDWDFGSTFQANTFIEFLKQIKYSQEGLDYPMKFDG